MRNLFGIIVTSLIVFSACENHSTSEKKQDTLKKDTAIVDQCTALLNDAKRLDNILLNATEVNKQMADNAILAFFNFANVCSEDSLAPIFLMKAGQVAQSVKQYPQAENLYIKCTQDFPDFVNRGAVLFLLAQLYDNATMLNSEESAKTIYNQIIKEYPNTPFANDAKACLKNLGKSDEELIQEFLKKNK